LRTGGSVLFNGIRVGEVTTLRLNPKNPRQVMATINVSRDTPVRADTKASLNFQGFTGIAALSLKGGDPDARPLEPPPGEEFPVIAVDAEATQDVTETAREVMRKVDAVVTENQASLRAALKNIDDFTAVLVRNSERFDRILGGIENLTGGPDGKGEISEAVKSFHALSDNLDKRTAEITKDFRSAIGTLERTIRNFDRNPQRIIFGNPNPPAR
jgi:phospholipid/cholesterol/gamma-HCH transport system substrate-binding protein